MLWWSTACTVARRRVEKKIFEIKSQLQRSIVRSGSFVKAWKNIDNTDTMSSAHATLLFDVAALNDPRNLMSNPAEYRYRHGVGGGFTPRPSKTQKKLQQVLGPRRPRPTALHGHVAISHKIIKKVVFHHSDVKCFISAV